VHDMRTTARRARAALAVFRPMLDAAVTEPIREGLTRLIRALEPARDAEVRQARSEELLADPTHAGFPGEVRSRLVAETSRSQDAALADIVAYLNSTEYYSLLDELDSVVARPPVSGAFGAAPRKAFRPVLVHEAKRAAKGIRRMRNDDLPSIHEARKAVRRFRLAAEALTEPPAEIFGARWAKLAAEASDLQDSMGDHRDAVLFVTHLESVARDATSAGENAAFYGMLAQEEKARADGLLSQVGDSAPRFRKAARAL
jgi:CHAD domain-containing protein